MEPYNKLKSMLKITFPCFSLNHFISHASCINAYLMNIEIAKETKKLKKYQLNSEG